MKDFFNSLHDFFDLKGADARAQARSIKRMEKLTQKQIKAEAEAKKQAKADYDREYNKLTNEQKTVLKILNGRIDTHNSSNYHSSTEEKPYYKIEEFLKFGISTVAQLNNLDEQEAKASNQKRKADLQIWDKLGKELDDQREKERREKEQRDQELSQDQKYLAEIEQNMKNRSLILKKK